MPGKKGAKRGVQYRRRRGGKKAGLNRLRSDVSLVKQFINKTLETKIVRWHDSVHINHSAPDVITLTDMPEKTGTTDDERIGNAITCMSIHFKAVLRNLCCNDIVRIIGVRWPCLDVNSSVVAGDLEHVLEYGHILTSTGIYQYPIDNVITSPYKKNKQKKNYVFFDKIYRNNVVPTADYNDGGTAIVKIDKYFKKGLLIQYMGDDITQTNHNQMTIFAICSNPNALTDTVNLTFTRSMKYKDA